MNYKIGQLVSIGTKDTKYELLDYLGEYRRNADGVRVFPVPANQIKPDGREHAYFEVWECLNLDTGKIESKKLPVYVYQENPDEFVDSGRKFVIDDTNEVTSLLDGAECWHVGRNGKNFHLNIVNDRHIEHISRLRELDSQNLEEDYAVGVRLKLGQKEHPNVLTRRRFKEWGIQFPDLLTKLIQDVYYQTNDDSAILSTESQQSE